MEDTLQAARFDTYPDNHGDGDRYQQCGFDQEQLPVYEMSAHLSLETPQSRTLASQLESSEKVFARHNKECMNTSAELLCMMMLVVNSECLGSSAKGQQ